MKPEKAAALVTSFVRPRFDYGLVPETVAKQAKESVERIRQHVRSSAIEIGRELLTMKEALPHGLFLPWVEAEFTFTRRTAVNLMQVAESFGDKWETVSHLPTTVLYQIAAPSTPEPIRKAVIERAQIGEIASLSSIKHAIEAANHTRPRRTAEERKAAEEQRERDRQDHWDKMRARDEARQAARQGAAGALANEAAEMAFRAMGAGGSTTFHDILSKLKLEGHLDLFMERLKAYVRTDLDPSFSDGEQGK